MSNARYLEANLMSQSDGNVFIEANDIVMIVRGASTMALLSTVLTAVRIEGDTEKMRACAMMCMATLGRSRFQ